MFHVIGCGVQFGRLCTCLGSRWAKQLSPVQGIERKLLAFESSLEQGEIVRSKGYGRWPMTTSDACLITFKYLSWIMVINSFNQIMHIMIFSE